MEFKHILYFETVRKHKSFSKAADELYVTQQAVSKKIRELEEELDAPLFFRQHNGVELTKEGDFFQEKTASILQTQNDILTYFSAISKQRKQELRVGLSHGLCIFFDKPFFEKFKQLQPDISLHILELWNPQTEEDVLNGSIDIGFTLAPVKYPQLHTEHLFSEPLCCIVNKNHPLASKESLTMEEILDSEIVMADTNYNSYHDFVNQCQQHDKHPKIHTVPDLFSIYEHCVHENVIGFSLESLSKTVQFKNIRHIPIEHSKSCWNVCLVWNDSTEKSRQIRKFIDYTLSNIN